ncbi:OsmC family protein [Microbulbifer rhizosphaerae]|uniref:Putative redox protein n=1 Tax=Microbulbifer rhizosphaerae TaxID=1562603 RepID=A0A7W4WGK3_9GAMM|nr:OsmC family protein [Microbulbifer rhizosphaerae]MBB3063397.1 putative redox protein [Microbulbifer rhizosphaerae]
MSGPTPTVVSVKETLEGKFIQDMHSGPHQLVADEPEDAGGDNKGPSPYEYVLMGLGACTSMTVRMYAERKEIPLERVLVVLSHRKVHAKDCEDCESKDGKIDEIIREITLEGPLTGEQRERLLGIANRCPVHQTLTSEIKVRTRLVLV